MRRTSGLSTSLNILIVLFLLGVGVVPAPLATAQDDTLTGWFTFIVADYPPESERDPEITYGLTDGHGQYHELLIDIELMQPFGGPVALNRKRVTVEGEWEEGEPDETEKFWVYSIELAPSPSPTSPERTLTPDLFPDEPAPPSLTLQAAMAAPQPWVTILCRFADVTQFTPHSVSHYERMMGSSEPGSLGHYWREASYGNIDLTGSIVVGWYDLPRPYSYYVYDRDGDGEEDHNTQRTAEDCTAAADADVFFPDFYGINLVFNSTIDGPSRGGSRTLIRDRGIKNYGVTWLTWPGSEYQDVWAHEMGHAFGLPHSSGPYNETYDSDWDVMSRGAFFSYHYHPGYGGSLGVHTIAYHKDFLGWIPPDRKYVALPNSRRTITLDRLAQPNDEGYLMAQIPIGYSTFYTVESRLFAGYDDGIPNEAIVIHKVDTTREDRLAQVVDIDNNGDPNDEGAMWTLGETFTDSENGIQVSVDATYSTGFQVTINTSPATFFTTCSESLLPTRQLFVGHGGNDRVEVVAPGGCSWTATSNSPWIRIADGSSGRGSGHVSYTVAANPNLNARTGTLTIAGQAFTVLQTGVNGNLFEDDLENGVNGWSSEHTPWALTTAFSRSGAYALTDSPGSNYRSNQHPWSSTIWSPVIDLTEVTSATLTFWHRYDFAIGDRGDVAVTYRRYGLGGLQTFTGTQTTWKKASIDLSPYAGSRIRLAFRLQFEARENADGWYIDDVAVSSSDFVTPEEPQAVLENPSSASFQSGIGVISGWACQAQEIVIELNGILLPAAYGTEREPAVERVCGHSDAGFSLLWNWNNLGPGTHTVRALLDGNEFANTTVRVTTFGEQVLRGVSGTFPLSDFPHVGDTTQVQWAESLQNFVITDGSAPGGGGYASRAGMNARLENPSLGSAQSGIAAISGWACDAQTITIELNGVPYRAGYPTTRPDTQGVCGDTDNGFSLLWNWNNLGPGTHTVRALLDGQEFANTTVRVTTLGEQVLRGVSGTFPLSDFPHAGDTTRVQWAESLQNFVIIP